MKGVLTDVVCVYVLGVPASKKATVMLILIVIHMVLQRPDYCSFGQIPSSAEGDVDLSSDNHGAVTPPLSMSCLSCVLTALACWQKIFPPRSLGDGVGGREGRAGCQETFSYLHST